MSLGMGFLLLKVMGFLWLWSLYNWLKIAWDTMISASWNAICLIYNNFH